jgi:MFS family permease
MKGTTPTDGRLEPPGAPAGLGPAIVPLVALSVFINYVDRGNIATAAPSIKDALGLSNTQLGLLLSAFFWSYTPGQLLASWLAERINAYRALALGLAVWSAATAVTAVAGSFAALFALRLAVGLGECATFPASSKLLAEHLPAHKLGSANGLIGVGLALGPAFGTFAGGMLIASAGWRSSFLVFGLASLLWLWPWIAATRKSSRLADKTAGPAPAFLEILAKPAYWGASLGHFSANYSFYFVITWLPTWLVKARGLSVTQMAELGGAIYLVYAASSLVMGRLADRWMWAGASATLIRKSFLIAGHVGVAAALAGATLGGPWAAIATVVAAAFFFGFQTPNLYAAGQTLAGRFGGGKWMGLQNGVGNLAGIIAPLLTGYTVDRTGGFSAAFLIAGAMSLLGVVGWGLIVPSIAPIAWRSAARAA